MKYAYSPTRFDRWAIRVSDLMTRNPSSIRADATIREAISLLVTKRVTAAPVINAAGRPIGVLSLSDLITGVRDHDVDGDELLSMQAEEVMTPFVFSVDLNTPVNAVVGELLDARIRQIYVADKEGTLIGVLSTVDLLKSLRGVADDTPCDAGTTAA